MNILVKCFHPEYYDAADCAVIAVTEDLVLMLDKRLAQAKAMDDREFYGTKWWDYTPVFIPTAGPDSVGLDEMSEEDFENTLDSNCYIRLADDYNPEDNDYARMSPITLTVSPQGFCWTGTDKYIGSSGRVETYELYPDAIDEWAEAIGCVEMLTKVRKCTGRIDNEVSC